MINESKIIIWDFDGVIIRSNKIRTMSFKKSLDFLNKDDLSRFIEYHENNGGLSRYHKLDWLKKELNINFDNGFVLEKFSKECCKQILKTKPIIFENLNIISKDKKNKHYIASGSDQKELRSICKAFNIDQYFSKILGSPISKIENVKSILKEVKTKNVILIGDSINDLEAAMVNQIYFTPYGDFPKNQLKYKKIRSRKWLLKNL